MNFIYDLTRRLFNTPGPEEMSASKELVEKAIKENKVVVFSKSYCPYCKKAKNLLDSLGVKYELFELDERPDGQAIQEYLKEKTGQRTVPNIFIKGQHIGGCDDLHAAHDSGKLQKLLDQ
ncbi:glutaredoxin [Spizellomyces punctatus DAOM BR117]|uniref:Glutaredoxin n=1 Tax=Spizellomyces punctatus (strain DAOM BR117) TaxID=645134 RepID=A0A0L0HVH8_SPIPD|nr:glutaredoxin [Spizellomyces punctatus DAOM BR117]KND05072.1 glutaredoxin [Spizellomyces punctatus DAOM BR117]|eukprot:XP_016613111.1 glutaredoxin [Spizellomyces punctatus DAOM BR117]